MKTIATFFVNGEPHEIAIEPNLLLIEVIRDTLGLTGTKHSCGVGNCGACTVLVEGEPMLACMTLAMAVRGRRITTIEGLAGPLQLNPLQQAFVDYGAIQCGYCTPGMILTAQALLDRNPDPSEAEVRHALSGNICRCTGYVKIVEAVLAAAAVMRGETPVPPGSRTAGAGSGVGVIGTAVSAEPVAGGASPGTAAPAGEGGTR